MKFSLERSIEILERTPSVLHSLLNELPDDWVMPNEGPETFSPYDVVGHLLHGEKGDWTGRTKSVLEKGTSQPFDPYDRFAMYEESKGKSMTLLLDEFSRLRRKNIEWLLSLSLSEADLDKKGLHPKFGEVTLRQLLSTWVVHDLTHLSQITRVMAKQYKEAVGPWAEFFRLLNF